MSKPIGIVPRLVLVGASAVFVLTWSSGFILPKIVTAEAQVLTILFWRFMIAGSILALGILWMRLRRGAPSRPAWRDIRPHLAIGFFAQVGYVLPIYLAVGAGVASGTTALIDAIQPLVVATLVGPLLGMRVRALQWVGLVLGAVGVALVVMTDAATMETPSPAYLLPLVALASLVTATFLERRSSARLSVFATMVTHAAVGLGALAILAGVTGTLAPPASPAFWISTVAIAVVPTLIAYALYWYLLRQLGITVLNALLYLVAPTTAVIGAVLFAEPFTAATMTGLLLGGIAVALVIAPGRAGAAGGVPAGAGASETAASETVPVDSTRPGIPSR